MRRKVFARLSTITHDMEMHALKNEVESNGNNNNKNEKRETQMKKTTINDDNDKQQQEELNKMEIKNLLVINDSSCSIVLCVERLVRFFPLYQVIV